MWVDVNGDNVEDSIDEVTDYAYVAVKGGSAGDSLVASGAMPQNVVYPPQSGRQSGADR